MTNRLTAILAAGALLAQCLFFVACTRGKGNTAAAGARGDDCYSTAGAVACPPDSHDTSGRKLPAPGGLCTLPPCKPCGSATAPAYRDSTGAPQAGWCICVPKSDDSGIGIYTCFSTRDWNERSR